MKKGAQKVLSTTICDGYIEVGDFRRADYAALNASSSCADPKLRIVEDNIRIEAIDRTVSRSLDRCGSAFPHSEVRNSGRGVGLDRRQGAMEAASGSEFSPDAVEICKIGGGESEPA
jgi:hypothetical protein